MLSFWAAALGIPLLTLAGNAALRWVCRLEQSSSADLILVFTVFDALVIIQHGEFEHYLAIEELRRDLVAIYVVLLFVNFFLWVMAAFHVERKLAAAFNNRTKRYNKVPYASLAQAYGISIVVFASNLVTFAYRG